jgi:hypothetical protein
MNITEGDEYREHRVHPYQKKERNIQSFYGHFWAVPD